LKPLPQRKILFLEDHVYAAYAPLPYLLLRTLLSLIELHWWGLCASDSDKNVCHTYLEADASGPCVVKCAKKTNEAAMCHCHY